MNIFVREVKANYKSFLVWLLALAGLVFLMMAVYPTFAKDMAKLEDLMAMYPEGFAKAFGLDRMSFANPLGFYGTECYIIIVLFGSIFTAILGASLLSKEEDEKTIEFLLARPVTRTSVLTQKLLTYVAYVMAFNIVLALVGYVSFIIFVEQDYSAKALVLLLTAPFLVHLTFASLGFLLALFFSRRRSVLSVSIGLVVGTYFLSVIALLTEGFEWLGWLSPFRYIDAADIVTTQSLDLTNVVVLLAVNVAAVGATYALYRRRDITL